MSSPAPSVSSADEEAKELAELKAKHEAELREASERKARKDQERRERREREKREKKEREEREDQETIGRLRAVYSVVAEKALSRIETKARAENARVREALTRVQGTIDQVQESAESEDEVGGPKGSEGASTSGEESVLVQRPTSRRVVASRPNTAEVVIVRPSKQGEGHPKPTGVDQVSRASSRPSSELMVT